MNNKPTITKKQAYKANGKFIPVAFLSCGKVHISAMSFPTLPEALEWKPGSDIKYAATQKDFVKHYGDKELLG